MLREWAGVAALTTLFACGRTGADPSIYGPPAEAGGAGGTGASSSSMGDGGAGATGSSVTAVSSSSAGVGGEGAAGRCGAGNQCEECMAEQCPDRWCTCQEEPECAALFACVGDCAGRQGCFGQCSEQHPDGISLTVLVSDCAATTCNGSCSFGQPLNECQTCRYEECPDQMNACLSNEECVDLIQCWQGCGQMNPTCIDDCANMFEGGLMGVQQVKNCTDANCGDVCP